jgi:hypothetical protein
MVFFSLTIIIIIQLHLEFVPLPIYIIQFLFVEALSNFLISSSLSFFNPAFSHTFPRRYALKLVSNIDLDS